MKNKLQDYVEYGSIFLLSVMLFTGVLAVRSWRTRRLEEPVILRGAFTPEISMEEFESMIAERRRFDINSACGEKLTVIPGVGPHLASAIIEHRSEKGPFLGPSDLLEVKGVGPAILERIEEYVSYGKKAL